MQDDFSTNPRDIFNLIHRVRQTFTRHQKDVPTLSKAMLKLCDELDIFASRVHNENSRAQIANMMVNALGDIAEVLKDPTQQNKERAALTLSEIEVKIEESLELE